MKITERILNRLFESDLVRIEAQHQTPVRLGNGDLGREHGRGFGMDLRRNGQRQGLDVAEAGLEAFLRSVVKNAPFFEQNDA